MYIKNLKCTKINTVSVNKEYTVDIENSNSSSWEYDIQSDKPCKSIETIENKRITEYWIG
ncbi:MAG: hypothetical protein ABRQ38_15110 [Candidatus Eremiobacterota bacterium]